MPGKMNNEEYGILSDDDSTYDDKEKKGDLELLVFLDPTAVILRLK